MKATVFMRNGGKWISEVTAEGDKADPVGIGRRMYGGFMILEDDWWQDGKRTIIINMADVSVVELVEDGQS